MDKNWPRWFFASITKHFETELSYKMFAEGEPRETWEEPDFFECRMDGPDSVELSNGIWEIRIEVNILIQSVLDFQDTHKIHRLAGEAAFAFTQPIIIYKYGSGVDDDNSQLVCLELLQSFATNEVVRINHFGQIKPDQGLLQATVEGRFKATIET